MNRTSLRQHLRSARILAGIAGMLVLLTYLATFAHSEAHHVSPPVLPGTPTFLMKKVMAQGYVTYALDSTLATYPNFGSQAAQVTAQSETVHGAPAIRVERDQSPDIVYLAPSDADFIKTCGQGAAACIWYSTQTPVYVFIRIALLYSDWKTTIAHEGINGGHAFGLHERYDDTTFTCITRPNPPTVMSCGSGIWGLTDFDAEWIRYNMVPRPLSSYYGMSYLPDRTEGYYCGADAARGTRVAIMAIAPDGTPYWSGLHLPVGPGCYSFRIVGDPGWCYSALVENGFSWRVYEQRNEVLLGCLG